MDQRETLQHLLTEGRKQLNEYRINARRTDGLKSILFMRRDVASQSARLQLQKLSDRLTDSTDHHLAEIEQICNDKEQLLNDQKKAVLAQMNCLTAICSRVTDYLQFGNEGKCSGKDCVELVSHLQEVLHRPISTDEGRTGASVISLDEDSMRLEYIPLLLESNLHKSTLGMLRTSRLDPREVEIVKSGNRSRVVALSDSAELKIVVRLNQECSKVDLDLIQAKITNTNSVRLPVILILSADCKKELEISFTPALGESYQLSVRIYDVHVVNSPYRFQVQNRNSKKLSSGSGSSNNSDDGKLGTVCKKEPTAEKVPNEAPCSPQFNGDKAEVSPGHYCNGVDVQTCTVIQISPECHGNGTATNPASNCDTNRGSHHNNADRSPGSNCNHADMSPGSSCKKGETSSGIYCNKADTNPAAHCNKAATNPGSNCNKADTSPRSYGNKADTSPRSSSNKADTSPRSSSNKGDTSPGSCGNKADINQGSYFNEVDTNSGSSCNKTPVLSSPGSYKTDVNSRSKRNETQVHPGSSCNKANSNPGSYHNKVCTSPGSHHNKAGTGSASYNNKADAGSGSYHNKVCTSPGSNHNKADTGSASYHNKADAGSGSYHNKADTGSGSNHNKADTGSGSYHNKADTGSGSYHNKADTGSGSYHNKADTDSGSNHNKADTGSGSYHNKADTGSGSYHNKADTGSGSYHNKADTGSGSYHNKADTGSGSYHKTDTGSGSYHNKVVAGSGSYCKKASTTPGSFSNKPSKDSVFIPRPVELNHSNNNPDTRGSEGRRARTNLLPVFNQNNRINHKFSHSSPSMQKSYPADGRDRNDVVKMKLGFPLSNGF